MSQKLRIIVGMSGGVDSSIAAFLLQQQGYAVEGLFMKNWEEDDTDKYCSAAKDLADAQAVCDRLNIKLHRVNFAAEYWDHVFEDFLREYQAGRTPNPDILCNKEIKFKAFLDYAKILGADKIATGHYARIQHQESGFQLLSGSDPLKDQSYFLYTLTQHQLSHSIFPVGELAKSQVRLIAKTNHFINHGKKDSTGICFIGERKFKEFLNRYLPHQPGLIKTPEGKVVGEHIGLMYYTLGQRQGLGIGGIKNSHEAPWYVVAKNMSENTLVIAQGHDHPLLYKRNLLAKQLHWIAGAMPNEQFCCAAKIRYRTQAENCEVTLLDDNQCHVNFMQPQWAITPGQSVVFYQGEICLGGGIIASTS